MCILPTVWGILITSNSALLDGSRMSSSQKPSPELCNTEEINKAKLNKQTKDVTKPLATRTAHSKVVIFGECDKIKMNRAHFVHPRKLYPCLVLLGILLRECLQDTETEEFTFL